MSLFICVTSLVLFYSLSVQIYPCTVSLSLSSLSHRGWGYRCGWWPEQQTVQGLGGSHPRGGRVPLGGQTLFRICLDHHPWIQLVTTTALYTLLATFLFTYVLEECFRSLCNILKKSYLNWVILKVTRFPSEISNSTSPLKIKGFVEKSGFIAKFQMTSYSLHFQFLKQ